VWPAYGASQALRLSENVMRRRCEVLDFRAGTLRNPRLRSMSSQPKRTSSADRRPANAPSARTGMSSGGATRSSFWSSSIGFEKQPGAFAVFVSESRDTPGAGLGEGIGPDLQTMYLRNRQMSKLFRIPKSHNIDPRRASIECQCLAPAHPPAAKIASRSPGFQDITS
jgi:hypothetical protein